MEFNKIYIQYFSAVIKPFHAFKHLLYR